MVRVLLADIISHLRVLEKAKSRDGCAYPNMRELITPCGRTRVRARTCCHETLCMFIFLLIRVRTHRAHAIWAWLAFTSVETFVLRVSIVATCSSIGRFYRLRIGVPWDWFTIEYPILTSWSSFVRSPRFKSLMIWRACRMRRPTDQRGTHKVLKRIVIRGRHQCQRPIPIESMNDQDMVYTYK